jgi:hypothetical protein
MGITSVVEAVWQRIARCTNQGPDERKQDVKSKLQDVAGHQTLRRISSMLFLAAVTAAISAQAQDKWQVDPKGFGLRPCL